ncbi:biopolymer transport protein ExbD [Hydrogenivirga caldilitoris]|uniref:Biopolymer transport protein ExbD n=1 Tax=Hydrogenivirga caldilitoris TaxID=246264 RepID=A0A497XMS7_9AQUI|nr:biopolymer transporter ExbD [Hydrogenivirga caldilitoris]RLJ70148.1 biopolymer transport protein ExbD [Hydrogenivirga caldilitoris]
MEEREFDYINVIPLVDIMLVLLTIVLTTATFIVQGEIPVNLPSAQSGETGKTHGAINITIKENGKLFLEEKEVHLAQLKEELKSLDREIGVNIRADREARIQNLVSVMDILNRLGFRKINMLVKKDEI